MKQDIDPLKLSSPRIFLVRMTVFIVLCALIAIVLYKQIANAFFANPGLNALIIGVLLIGIVLAYRQVARLFPEVSWVNSFRLADPGLASIARRSLLAPMATILCATASDAWPCHRRLMRGLLNSIATRLDKSRDILR